MTEHEKDWNFDIMLCDIGNFKLNNNAIRMYIPPDSSVWKYVLFNYAAKVVRHNGTLATSTSKLYQLGYRYLNEYIASKSNN